MKKYSEQRFTGERALYQSKDVVIDHSVFEDGESPLKESKKISVYDSVFRWKYPFWYCQDITLDNSVLDDTARAGIWYTDRIEISNTTIDAPKTFRKSSNITLNHVSMTDASETFWNCQNITMKDVSAKGDYFAMGSRGIEADGLTIVGGYAFDGVKDVTIRNAKIMSKDAFWNSENVIVYDSFISGQYIGWNSKNITFINCTIESEQGFCYIENLVMKDCKLVGTDLAFEYSTIDVTIDSHIDSIKNPISGKIKAVSIGEIIYDNPDVAAENTRIETRCYKPEVC